MIHPSQLLIETPSGKTAELSVSSSSSFINLENLICASVKAAVSVSTTASLSHAGTPSYYKETDLTSDTPLDRFIATPQRLQRILQNVYLSHQGKPLTRPNWRRELGKRLCTCADNELCDFPPIISLQLKCRVLGGTDRQNRVGSKFGGGGVSSSANAERERKERLKRLALESIDLAKDPYLIRNHLGSYECRLCLTLHRDEANYLAHTQGKKHQQGLAHRAFLEKQQQQKDGVLGSVDSTTATNRCKPASSLSVRKVRIGRPAYQVYKSRDPDTNQRCLTFELSYPEITEGIQPRHRFMSAFEQKIESPADRRYQYLLFAADPYETISFKIPNEPIDKGENRFVTYWDTDTKKFTVALYFLDSVVENSTLSTQQ